MNLALTALNITAPVFILAAVGFCWVKLGFEYRVEFVTRLAMTLSVPCLIFVVLMNANLTPRRAVFVARMADTSLPDQRAGPDRTNGDSHDVDHTWRRHRAA